MIGAIIGDIVGSRFEFNNHRDKNFVLFTDECQVTDDSIMTLAVAKAIMETEKRIKPSLGGDDYDSGYYSLIEDMTIKYMQEIGRKYPNCGYGGMFSEWVFSNDPEPYNSFGNGAAMRISPVGFAARTESEACWLSEVITGVTHDHEEGLKGAEATAVAIYMAQRGYTKKEIRDKIISNYYALDFTIDEIKDTYQFNETCQDTVPQAIEAFLESHSFEDAIRNAISIGGDSDTIAAITGAIAEAYYGVPEELKEVALSYLDDELRSIFKNWSEFIGDEGKVGKYHVLTKYIGKIFEAESLGRWFIDREKDGTSEHPIQMPYVNNHELIDTFVMEFYQFLDSHPEYRLSDYHSILESNGLKWDNASMREADIDTLNAECTLALIMGAIRVERFCDGALLSFFEDGSILKWLKHLKRIESSDAKASFEEIYFEIGGFCSGYDKYRIVFRNGLAQLVRTPWFGEPIEKHYSPEEAKQFLNTFEDLHVEYWNSEYNEPYICDGTQWELAVKYEGQRGTVWVGSNAYPNNWEKLLFLFGIEGDDDEETSI